jgi:hypothetical protein
MGSSEQTHGGTRNKLPQRPPADEAIFVARDGRRARRLTERRRRRRRSRDLWVVGLGIGMLGFGSLPAWRSSRALGSTRVARPSPMPTASGTRDACSQPSRSTFVQPVPQRDCDATRRRAARRCRAKRPSRTGRDPSAAARQTPSTPRTHTRLVAQGHSAPRGQLRKAAPPPPPATSRGRHVGRRSRCRRHRRPFRPARRRKPLEHASATAAEEGLT